MFQKFKATYSTKYSNNNIKILLEFRSLVFSNCLYFKYFEFTIAV